jgi:hypothetical protein
LQGLRQTVLDLISDFGDQNNSREYLKSTTISRKKNTKKDDVQEGRGRVKNPNLFLCDVQKGREREREIQI